MAALVTVHNDGPDAVELRVGRRSVLLSAGEEFRMSTANVVSVGPLPKIDPQELALHMGTRPDVAPCRYAEE